VWELLTGAALSISLPAPLDLSGRKEGREGLEIKANECVVHGGSTHEKVEEVGPECR
jgi:hypothetical protein